MAFEWLGLHYDFQWILNPSVGISENIFRALKPTSFVLFSLQLEILFLIFPTEGNRDQILTPICVSILSSENISGVQVFRR
jgi:hypothetical protein